MAEAWVINASPLILLAKIGLIAKVPALAEPLVVPGGHIGETLFHEVLRRAGEES